MPGFSRAACGPPLSFGLTDIPAPVPPSVPPPTAPPALRDIIISPLQHLPTMNTPHETPPHWLCHACGMPHAARQPLVLTSSGVMLTAPIMAVAQPPICLSGHTLCAVSRTAPTTTTATPHTTTPTRPAGSPVEMPPGGFTPINATTAARSRAGQRLGGYRSQSAAAPAEPAAGRDAATGSISNRAELDRLAAGLTAKGRFGMGRSLDDEDDDEFMRLEQSLGSRQEPAPAVGGIALKSRAQSAAPPPVLSMREAPKQDAVTASSIAARSGSPTSLHLSRRGAGSGTLARYEEDDDETAEFERLEAELALASARGQKKASIQPPTERMLARSERAEPAEGGSSRVQLRRPVLRSTTTPPPSIAPGAAEKKERAPAPAGGTALFSQRGAREAVRESDQPVVSQTSQPLRFPSPVPRISDSRFLRTSKAEADAPPPPPPPPAAEKKAPETAAPTGGASRPKLTFRNRLSSPRGGSSTAAAAGGEAKGEKPATPRSQPREGSAPRDSAFSRPNMATTMALRSSLTAAPAAPPAAGDTDTDTGVVIPQNIILRRGPPPAIVDGGSKRQPASPPRQPTRGLDAVSRQTTLPQRDGVEGRASPPHQERAEPERAEREAPREQRSQPASWRTSARGGSPPAAQQPAEVVRPQLHRRSHDGDSSTKSSPLHMSPEVHEASPESVVVLNPPSLGGHSSESPMRNAEDEVAYLDYISRLVQSLPRQDGPQIPQIDDSILLLSTFEKLHDHILPTLQQHAARLDLTEDQRGELQIQMGMIAHRFGPKTQRQAPEEESWLLSNDSFDRMTGEKKPAAATPTAVTSQPISRRTVPAPGRDSHSREEDRDSEKAERTSIPSTSSKNSSAKGGGRSGTGPLKSLEMKIESQDRKLQRQSQRVTRLQQENSELTLRVKALSASQGKISSSGGTPNSSFQGRTSPGRSDPSTGRVPCLVGTGSPQSHSASTHTVHIAHPVSRPVTPGARAKAQRMAKSEPQGDRTSSPRGGAVTPSSRLTTPGAYLGHSSAPGDLAFRCRSPTDRKRMT